MIGELYFQRFPLKIATRLFAGFGVIQLLLVGVTLVGISKVNYIDRTMKQVDAVDAKKQRYAINFRGSVHDRAIAVRDLVSPVVTAQERQGFLQQIRELETFYQDSAGNMDQLFSQGTGVTTEERRLLDDIKRVEAENRSLMTQFLNMLNSGRMEEAQTFLQRQIAPSYTAWLAAINRFIDYQEAAIAALGEGVRESSSEFATLMMVITALALVVGFVVAYRLVTHLLRTIGGEPDEAAQVIRGVASGDLTRTIQTAYPYSIMGAVATMTTKLAEIIRDVSNTATRLVEASDSLARTAGANQDLMVTQLQQTDQSAAAIKQMAVTVQAVAGHTLDAANLAQSADEEAASGSGEVNKTIASIEALAREVESAAQVIHKLSENSAKIGSVLEVIQNIAAQTNLLALNAAIEAARAGEHGRGFAVVADEVRALASRTQDSTRDIQMLIEQMQSSADSAVSVMEQGRGKASDSVTQAKRAGDSLRKINQSVASINGMNTQIATAAEEQSMVAEEISRNITQITEASQKAAEGANRTGASSRELVSIANRLQERVEQFRL